MKQKFTPNDLIRFIYKETTPAEMLDIMDALNEDYCLAEEYEILLETYQQLPKARLQPSFASLQNILLHSQNSSYSYLN